MRLNIVSGEYALGVLGPRLTGDTVPCNEAMLTGAVCDDVFSPAFCRVRAAALDVPESLYAQKLRPLTDALARLTAADEAHLFFGADTFCQINLLAVLAWLDAHSFAGPVWYIQTDDVTCAAQAPARRICPAGYAALYTKALVLRQLPACPDPLMRRALERYFDIASPEGTLARLIRDNAALPERELLRKVMAACREDGLGDTQALELITRFR